MNEINNSMNSSTPETLTVLCLEFMSKVVHENSVRATSDDMFTSESTYKKLHMLLPDILSQLLAKMSNMQLLSNAVFQLLCQKHVVSNRSLTDLKLNFPNRNNPLCTKISSPSKTAPPLLTFIENQKSLSHIQIHHLQSHGSSVFDILSVITKPDLIKHLIFPCSRFQSFESHLEEESDDLNTLINDVEEGDNCRGGEGKSIVRRQVFSQSYINDRLSLFTQLVSLDVTDTNFNDSNLQVVCENMFHIALLHIGCTRVTRIDGLPSLKHTLKSLSLYLLKLRPPPEETSNVDIILELENLTHLDLSDNNEYLISLDHSLYDHNSSNNRGMLRRQQSMRNGNIGGGLSAANRRGDDGLENNSGRSSSLQQPSGEVLRRRRHMLIQLQDVLESPSSDNLETVELERIDTVHFLRASTRREVTDTVSENSTFPLPNLQSLDLSGRQDVHLSHLTAFLETHVHLKFIGLLHSNSSFDQSLHTLYPNMSITGSANENQIVETLRRYPLRSSYVQKAMYNLFRLTQGVNKPRPDLISLVVDLCYAYSNTHAVQMAATACLFNLTRFVDSNQTASSGASAGKQLHPSVLKSVVDCGLSAMATFPDHQQLQKNVLLTIYNDRILQHVPFNFYVCVQRVMQCLVRYSSDLAIARMCVTICSILASKLTNKQTTEIGSHLPNMERLLALVHRSTLDVQVDDTLKFTLSALWNLTDECQSSCEAFLANDGLNLYLQVLETFEGQMTVETRVLGLFNNIAEVEVLRERLISDRFLTLVCKLMKSEHLDVAYFATGISAHLVSISSVSDYHQPQHKRQITEQKANEPPAIPTCGAGGGGLLMEVGECSTRKRLSNNEECCHSATEDDLEHHLSVIQGKSTDAKVCKLSCGEQIVESNLKGSIQRQQETKWPPNCTISRAQLVEDLKEVVINWEIPTTEMVAYRSFRPFFPLLQIQQPESVKLWAIWAIHHVCSMKPSVYCEMLRSQGGVPYVQNIIDDDHNSIGGDNAVDTSYLVTLCRQIMSTFSLSSDIE